MANQLFLSLDDAVLVASTEFEQKCYISNDQYSIGYCTALEEVMNNCKRLLEE